MQGELATKFIPSHNRTELVQGCDPLNYEVVCVECYPLREQINNRKTLRVKEDPQHGFLGSDSLLDLHSQFLVDSIFRIVDAAD
jgi:hypothetical protein